MPQHFENTHIKTKTYSHKQSRYDNVPMLPCRKLLLAQTNSVAEFYSKLREAVGSHTSVFNTSAISLTNYKTDSFIVGMTTQRILSETPDTNMSGTSTKAGDLLRFVVNNVNANVDTAHVVMNYDLIIQISEEGVSVFD